MDLETVSSHRSKYTVTTGLGPRLWFSRQLNPWKEWKDWQHPKERASVSNVFGVLLITEPIRHSINILRRPENVFVNLSSVPYKDLQRM
ncbi:uncharacterized protein ARMOST_14437 [Armillaria ostoyae]|uniref:Uncharacterized protein n=1 Tax=Armillaria ostoyae TaxID=47428 RepID=A0A284RQI2_ARMOS|nr:uncharacterized protein ARMOST_14437 [Armillaria ostoyae]